VVSATTVGRSASTSASLTRYPPALSLNTNLSEGALYSLPDDVSFELATLLEPLSIAVHAVDCAGIDNGQTVAIFGGETIGLLCLAVALNAGACKVLVSEPIAPNER